MKKSLIINYSSILLIALTLITSCCTAQKLKKNEIDEFEGVRIKETTWETLTFSTELNSYFRIRQVDTTFYFNMKFFKGYSKPYFVDTGEVLAIKFDDSVIKLNNQVKIFTTKGGGSRGINGSGVLGAEIHCLMNREQLEALKNGNLKKVRVYTSIGYFEAKISKNNSKKVNKAVLLILDTTKDR